MTVEYRSTDGPAPDVRRPRAFATTHWSLVARAGMAPGSEGRAALEHLCRVYWYPLYGFARRMGLAQADAEDATQGFFEHLLETGAIARADPARGRFRTFLLSSFRNFLGHERARAGARKRGGGTETISIEGILEAEGRFSEEPATTDSPEALFDRQWALRTLGEVFDSARREYEATGRTPLFDELKTALWGETGDVPYAEIARRLATTEGAIKMAAMRLRRRVREVLRAEVAKTLLDPADVEQELRHLLAALGP